MIVWNRFTKGMPATGLKLLLVVIAALLGLDLLLRVLIPAAVMGTSENDYQKFVVACENALRSATEARRKTFDSEQLRESFNATVQIELLNCVERDLVKENLLSWSVSPSSIRAVELKAVLNPLAISDEISINERQVDLHLARVVEQFHLRPLQTRSFREDPKFVLGRALFFDPVLSGSRDVSCATCHLLKHGTSDALPRSIGVSGKGLGHDRRLIRGEVVHPRNSLDLWNRDHNAVKSLFWDGRVEVLDPVTKTFRSPLGAALPRGLENALAVQALFPLVKTDEMLGESGDRSSQNLPDEHADQPNDLVPPRSVKTEIARIQEAHRRIMIRLLGSHARSAQTWQSTYRSLFKAAYGERRESSYSVIDLANAIAHFEELAFATRQSAWDQYLTGQPGAISKEAKAGALIFFGRGRCAVCHESPLFSDFNFHSIGIPLAGIRDLGRWQVTRDAADRYKFRTPPLRNVTKTTPYFHNGSEPTLRGAITRHLDPLADADKYNEDGSFKMTAEEVNSVSTILLPKVNVGDPEIDWLMAFLSSLEYEPPNTDVIVPRAVPSGLPVVYE